MVLWRMVDVVSWRMVDSASSHLLAIECVFQAFFIVEIVDWLWALKIAQQSALLIEVIGEGALFGFSLV